MSGIGLNIGLKALLASQTALENIGHNVSNANTPGYSRQNVSLASAPAVMVRGLAIGNGVNASNIQRTADLLLHRRLVTQESALTGLDTRLGGMAQVEALFGEPGDQGLNSLMQSFYTSLSSLSASPDDLVRRTGAIQSSQTLSGRFNELSTTLIETRRDTASQIKGQVEKVNTLAEQIAGYNRQIAGFESGNMTANDLRDKRDEAVKSLGKLINITFNEGADGNVTVQTNGALLVGQTKAYAMSVQVDTEGAATLRVQGSTNPIQPKSGTIGGLLQISGQFVPELLQRIDLMAHEFIREANRAHSTGVPMSGPFQTLSGAYPLQDLDSDGAVNDELLANAGLPFDITTGSLYVNVTDRDTGQFTRSRVDITAETTTVQDLLDSLNAIPNMNASIDSFGRLQVRADEGYGFDFSARMNPRPDVNGTFGSARASIGSLTEEPFALAGGMSLNLSGPGGGATVTFNSTQFADITQATAEEVAAAINSNPAVTTIGMQAVAQGGHVFLQSLGEGPSETITLSGGTALGALGWTAGQSASGTTNSVAAQISGAYTGSSNVVYTLVPTGDGIVGTTPDLEVEVYDSSGALVATLDVGAGYQPGTPLSFANGLKVSFGLGELAASDGDRLQIEALADSDTSDVLVGLGLNALYIGEGAQDIAVRADLAADPRLFSASGTGAVNDNGALKNLLSLRDMNVGELSGTSFGEYYGDLVGGLAFDIESAGNAREVEQFLSDTLNTRREQISGVNIDEELVNMIQFQQSYSAAARYITVVNATSEEVLRLL